MTDLFGIDKEDNKGSGLATGARDLLDIISMRA
jgi:hypothetical protein